MHAVCNIDETKWVHSTYDGIVIEWGLKWGDQIHSYRDLIYVNNLDVTDFTSIIPSYIMPPSPAGSTSSMSSSSNL
jgi:hypothetical protein